MTKTAVKEDESQRLLRWRLAAFERLGIDYPHSLELALSSVAVHDAEDMADAGCEPELLVRILL